MSDTIGKIRETAPSYGSIPFWSWNDRLEEGELRRQIGRMQELGMSGFFMHARGGLETEYLSDEWFHAVNVCIDEAKKRGMEAWSYDENGWPSGFAGGKLLNEKKNFALGLLWEYTDTFPAPVRPQLRRRAGRRDHEGISAPDPRGIRKTVRRGFRGRDARLLHR